MKRKIFGALVSIVVLWGQTTLAHGGDEPRVALEAELSAMSAGQSQYMFQLLDTESNTVLSDVDLSVTHEKKLHLIIYDPSLQEFQHLHPVYDSSMKMWTVDVAFEVSGKYWVWVQGEVASDGTEFSSSARLDVTGGTTAWPTPPKLGDLRTGSSGTSQVTLDSTKLKAGKMAMQKLAISRTDGTAPKLEPYLGAFAHVIAVPEDGDELIHVHPMSGAAPDVGMLHTSFPIAGDYRLWVQFMDDGILRTVPLSVTVY